MNNKKFNDYLQSQALTSITPLFWVSNLLVSVAFIVDIIYAPTNWNSIEWKVVFLSTPSFVICLAMLTTLYTKDLLKYLSPITAIFVFGFFYSSITWIGTVLKLNYFQAIYIALMNFGFAFFAFGKKQYLTLSSLAVISYILGRFLTANQPDLFDVWVSFDLLVAFTFILGFPIQQARLKHYEIFFNNLQTIEEQKALNIYSSKMSALGEMAAGMAHEINNPLAIVSGMAFQIIMYLEKNIENRDLKIKESALRITQTVNRIAKIISSLRMFSKQANTASKDNIDIDKTINDTLDLCRLHLEEKGITLTLVNQCKTKTIHSNSVSIMQILLNLINNSVDAISPSANKWIQILITDSPGVTNKIQILISDSGAGIPGEFQDKIMQPFFTTKPVGQGTGLGLSTSKGLAESIGGQLYYDNKSPNTTFILELPIQ